MIWVACYDISDDKVRSIASAMLLSFGFERVQRSVFICHDTDIPELLAELDKLKTRLSSDDLLFIIPLCADCQKSAIWVKGELPPPPPTFKII